MGYRSKMGFFVMLLAATCWSVASAQSTGSLVSPAGGVSGSVSGGPTSVQQSGQVYTENFEGGKPTNWEFLDGAAVVQSGQSNVLTFSGAGIAAWGVQPSSDFTLNLRIRQGGGAPEIMLSHTGEPPNEKYYVVRLFPDETEVVKFIGAQQSPLGFVGGKGIGAGTWTSVEVTMSGGGQSIAVSVGGQPMLPVQDPQPLGTGMIAFRAVGQGGTEIDDLVLTLGSASSSSPIIQGGSQGTTPVSPPETPQQGGQEAQTSTTKKMFKSLWNEALEKFKAD